MDIADHFFFAIPAGDPEQERESMPEALLPGWIRIIRIEQIAVSSRRVIPELFIDMIPQPGTFFCQRSGNPDSLRI